MPAVAGSHGAVVRTRFVDLDALDPALARTLTTERERDRAARRATPTLRRRAVASIASRRLVAAEALGVEPAGVVLDVGPCGRRTALADGRRVSLSVSSCDGLGLVAVATGADVGCDVEDFGDTAVSRGFVERVASKPERDALVCLDAAARREALLRLWTRKEAYLKATGEGIGAALRRVAVPLDDGHWTRAFDPRGDGCAWWCVALEAPSPRHAAAVVAGPARGARVEVVVGSL